MANSFKLTKRNFNRVKNKYERHRAFRCPKCHQQFEIGDVIIRVGVLPKRPSKERMRVPDYEVE